MHNYNHISGASSASTKNTAGKLLHITINTVGGSTMTVYDSLAASGKEMAVITPTEAHTLDYSVPFQTGLFIVTTGSGDFTVVFD